MKKISKVTAIVAKIIEVFHWIGVVSMAAMFIMSFVMKESLTNRFGIPFNDGANVATNFSIYDFDLMVIGENGDVNILGMRIGFFCGILLLSLWAMVFRNVYLVAKNTMKKENNLFCEDNLRMVREIGIFTIASPVVSLTASTIARIILGHEAEISVGFNGFIIGLLVIFLTQFFIKGAEIEKDIEGLI